MGQVGRSGMVWFGLVRRALSPTVIQNSRKERGYGGRYRDGREAEKRER